MREQFPEQKRERLKQKAISCIEQARKVIEMYPGVDYSEIVRADDDPEPLVTADYERARLSILHDVLSDAGEWNDAGVEGQRSAADIMERLTAICDDLRRDENS